MSLKRSRRDWASNMSLSSEWNLNPVTFSRPQLTNSHRHEASRTAAQAEVECVLKINVTIMIVDVEKWRGRQLYRAAPVYAHSFLLKWFYPRLPPGERKHGTFLWDILTMITIHPDVWQVYFCCIDTIQFYMQTFRCHTHLRQLTYGRTKMYGCYWFSHFLGQWPMFISMLYNETGWQWQRSNVSCWSSPGVYTL